MPVVENQHQTYDDRRVFGRTQEHRPVTTYQQAMRRRGTCCGERIEFAAYTLLASGIVLRLGGVEQIVEQLIDARIVQVIHQPDTHLPGFVLRTAVLHVIEKLFA